MKIYKPAGRAREYSPLALNYFKGCDNGCKYCYVPNMMKRFNKKYDHRKVKKPTKAGFNELKKSAEKMRGCDQQILLSFTGDPYCNVENRETGQILEILNFYGHKVAILTKQPEKALKDINIIKKFGENIKVGSTLTFNNESDSKEWETRAATPVSRITGLQEFAKYGIKTWASFEPVIKPTQSISLLNNITNFIDYVKIGKLNNYKGLDKKVDWNNFLDAAVEVCRKNNLKFYIKKGLQKYKGNLKLSENETNEDYLNL